MDTLSRIKLYGHDLKRLYIEVPVAMVTLGLAWYVLRQFMLYENLAPLVLMPIILLGVHYYDSLPKILRGILIGLMLGAIVIFSYEYSRIARRNIADPPEFDVRPFWIYAHTAAQGLNYYDAANLRATGEIFEISEEALAQLYFFYPPPAIFFFLPMGWFDVNTGVLLWYGAQTLALIANIVLLWRIFITNKGLLGLLLAATLLLMLHATLMTFIFGQINFLTLLFVLLFWKDREKLRGSIWISLAVLTKPYTALLLLYPLLQRKWRFLGGVVATAILVSLITVINFGPQIFLSYFTNPAFSPESEQIQINGAFSILGAIARQAGPTASVTFSNPVFLLAALGLTVLTAGLILRLGESRADWGIALILPLALLIYPVSGEHYAIVLVIPFLLLWKHRQELLGNVWGITGFVTIEYLLFNYTYHEGEFAVIALALNWCVMALAAFQVSGRLSPQVPGLPIPAVR